MPRVQPHAQTNTHSHTDADRPVYFACILLRRKMITICILCFCVCQALPGNMVLCSRLNTCFFTQSNSNSMLFQRSTLFAISQNRLCRYRNICTLPSFTQSSAFTRFPTHRTAGLQSDKLNICGDGSPWHRADARIFSNFRYAIRKQILFIYGQNGMHVNVNNFECIIMAETIYLYYLHIDGESMTNATWCIELLIRSVVQTIPWDVECITCANTLAIQTKMCHDKCRTPHEEFATMGINGVSVHLRIWQCQYVPLVEQILISPDSYWWRYSYYLLTLLFMTNSPDYIIMRQVLRRLLWPPIFLFRNYVSSNVRSASLFMPHTCIKAKAFNRKWLSLFSVERIDGTQTDDRRTLRNVSLAPINCHYLVWTHILIKHKSWHVKFWISKQWERRTQTIAKWLRYFSISAVSGGLTIYPVIP